MKKVTPIIIYGLCILIVIIKIVSKEFYTESIVLHAIVFIGYGFSLLYSSAFLARLICDYFTNAEVDTATYKVYINLIYFALVLFPILLVILGALFGFSGVTLV